MDRLQNPSTFPIFAQLGYTLKRHIIQKETQLGGPKHVKDYDTKDE